MHLVGDPLGQLGLGADAGRRVTAPCAINGCPLESRDGSVLSLSAGAAHLLLVTTAGVVWACGSNMFKKLGLGDGTPLTVPTLQPLIDALLYGHRALLRQAR